MTCYVDSTVALPLLTAYALTRREPRPLKRITDKLPELMRKLEARYADVVRERGDARG